MLHRSLSSIICKGVIIINDEREIHRTISLPKRPNAPPDRDHESAVLGVDAGVSEPIPNRACALRHYGWAVSPPCSKLASTRRTRKEIIYTSDSHIKRLPDSSGLRQVRDGVMPAPFALIQRLNQFLNQRTQLRGVTFICHRNTKFAPVVLHAVSHTHLRYWGAECSPNAAGV